MEEKLVHHSVKINGKKFHYVRQGSGKLLLLLHAGGASWRDWEKIIPVLANNFLVIAPDMPGCGESEEIDSHHNLDNYELFVDDLLKALGYGWSRVYLMGISFGGMSALRFALEHPRRVKKMVLMETTYYYPHPIRRPWVDLLSRALESKPAKEKAEKIIYKMGKRGLFRPLDMALGPGFRQSSARAKLEILYSWSKMDLPEKDLRELKVPTLLLAAENDIEIPVDSVRKLANLLPRSKFFVISGFSHHNFGSSNLGTGGLVDKLILSFLSSSLIAKIKFYLTWRVLKSS